MTAERTKLAVENIPLARSLVKRYEGKGIEYDDLYQAACLGLTKAATNFDDARGLKFSTYAVPVILGEIKQLFRKDGTVTVSRSIKELSVKIRRVSSEYHAKGSSAPKISELASIMGESVERINEALCSAEPVISIEDAYGAAQPSKASFEDEVIDIVTLRTALSRLSAEEKCILKKRYIDNHTQNVVASQLGISQVQVSRTEKKILIKLRELIVEREE